MFDCTTHSFASTVHDYCPFCRLEELEKKRQETLAAMRARLKPQEFCIVPPAPPDSEVVRVMREMLSVYQQRCYEGSESNQKLRARNDQLEREAGIYRVALNQIAAWTDGDIGSHMDEPGSAATARAALLKGERRCRGSQPVTGMS